MLHPGHFRYLEQARKYANQLYVAVEGDRYFDEKGLEKQFSEAERAQSLAALEIVDRVILLDSGGLLDLVQNHSPKCLVLGREFERERYSNVAESIDYLNSNGIKVVYEAGVAHYASLDLFRSSQTDLEEEKSNQFNDILQRHEINLFNLLDRISRLNPRILVIGDTIVDQYVVCDAIGMSAEAPVVVLRELETREYLGGAAIVASHLKALGADCYYLSVLGDDSNADWVREKLDAHGINTHIIEDAKRPTTIKIRYMVENQKLFRVSRLREHSISKAIERVVFEHLEQLSPDLDGIVISDFVYGVISSSLLGVISEIAEKYQVPLFGDLQCSSQIGSVLKFKNFNLICPTEREARIALANQEDGVEWVANALMNQSGAENLIIKLGAEGFIAYGKNNDNGFRLRQHFPALTVNPLDVTGAGDSLLSAMAVSITSGGSFLEACSLGSCVASLAVQTVGNVPVSRERLETFLKQMVGNQT